MSEAALTKQVKKYLDEIKAEVGNDLFYQKISDRFTDGIPDYYIIYKGQSLWLELKAAGEKPRAIQSFVLKRLKQAGSMADWADNINKAKVLIDILVYNVPKQHKKTKNLH